MNIKKVDLEKIKTFRKKAKISLDEMSKLLGYDSPNGYYYLETGRVKFSADKLAIIANQFNVSLDELFFEVKIAKMAND